MALRYIAALTLTLALISIPATCAAACKPVPRSRHHRHASAALPSLPPDQIYSPRALRQARIVLQLKLLELKSERLERVRKVLEKHLPVDQLLKER